MPAVRTHGGTFSTDAPGYYSVRGDNRGCDIKLLFTPEDPVLCPKIGLVQSVTTNKGGVAYNVGSDARKAEQAARSLSVDEENEQGIGGRHIDRAEGKVNPVYGMNNPTGGSKELGSSTESGNCHNGKRIQKLDKTFETDAAWLTDGPTLNSAGVASEQVFETTALCLEGDMKGTYLGSVKWGYTKTDADVITLVPFAVVSMGAPTQSWMLAAQKWNTTQTSVGGTNTDNLKLPTTTHETKNPTTKPQVSKRLFELRSKLGGIDKNRDSTNYKNVEFEIKALETKLKTL